MYHDLKWSLINIQPWARANANKPPQPSQALEEKKAPQICPKNDLDLFVHISPMVDTRAGPAFSFYLFSAKELGWP